MVDSFIDAGGAERSVSPSTPMPVASPNASPSFTKGAAVTTNDLVAQTVGAVTTALAAVDCVDFQSVSLQVNADSAYTGTFQVQVSNDGINWRIKQVLNINDGTTTNGGTYSANTGLLWMASGDLGSRFVRIQQTSWTAGQIRVFAVLSALSTATVPRQGAGLDSGSNIIGGVLGGHSQHFENGTLLAAGANLTGTTQDAGATDNRVRARARVLVQHQAGLTPGHVAIEQSTDNTNWRETERWPVPSDGSPHGFEGMIHLRYWRVRFYNGATAQTTFFVASYAVGIDGISVDAKQNLQFQVAPTDTAIAASTVYTGPTLDLGTNHIWSTLRAVGRSDVTGCTLGVQQSPDGTNWYSSVDDQKPLVSAGQAYTLEAKITMRFVRPVIFTGSNAVTAARLAASLLSL